VRSVFRARRGMGVAAVDAQAERAPLVDNVFHHQLAVAVAVLDSAAAGAAADPNTVRSPQTAEPGARHAPLLT